MEAFKNLTDQTAAEIERLGQVEKWNAGAMIFNEGEACTGMHVLTHGLVQVYRSGRGGREQIVHLQAPGSILAVTPLLDEQPYPVSARALNHSETFFLPFSEFRRLLTERSDFTQAMLRDMAARHRKTLGLLDTIALKPVIARVATLLVEAAIRENASRDEGQFELMLTQEQLANEIATTREGVARSFAKLRKDSVIEQQSSRIRVLNWEKLIEMSEPSLAASA